MENIQSVLKKTNKRSINLIHKYQNIPVGDKRIKTPYFINDAEEIYRQLMITVGIRSEEISKIISAIRKEKTPLSSGAGKGSPEEISRSVIRLNEHLINKTNTGLFNMNERSICEWLKIYHIGIDCSGFVYNVFLHSLDEDTFKRFENLLNWADLDIKRPSHAGVFVFNSSKFDNVNSPANFLPLDILIEKNNTHIGVIVEKNSCLYLAESITGIGIQMNKIIVTSGTTFRVENRDFWNKHINQNQIVVKRFAII